MVEFEFCWGASRTWGKHWRESIFFIFFWRVAVVVFEGSFLSILKGWIRLLEGFFKVFKRKSSSLGNREYLLLVTWETVNLEMGWVWFPYIFFRFWVEDGKIVSTELQLKRFWRGFSDLLTFHSHCLDCPCEVWVLLCRKKVFIVLF